MLASLVWYAVGRQRADRAEVRLLAVGRGGLPAWVVLGLFFLTNLWSGALSVVNPAYGGAVGWWAHIGGFVAGARLRQAVPQAADRAARSAPCSS